jgi:hypothetical protein
VGRRHEEWGTRMLCNKPNLGNSDFNIDFLYCTTVHFSKNLEDTRTNPIGYIQVFFKSHEGSSNESVKNERKNIKNFVPIRLFSVLLFVIAKALF